MNGILPERAKTMAAMKEWKKLNSNQEAIATKLEEMAKEMREKGFICTPFTENDEVMLFANKNYGEIMFSLNDGISIKAKLY